MLARLAARLVLQSVLLAFPLKGEFTIRGTTVSIETHTREGKYNIFLLIDPLEMGNRVYPTILQRPGPAGARRLVTSVLIPAEREDDLLFACRLLAGVSSTLKVYGRPASLKEFNDWSGTQKHFDLPRFEEALAKANVDLTKFELIQTGLSCRKPFLEFRAFYDTVLTHFANYRVDTAGWVWRAEYQINGVPVAWVPVTRGELGLPELFNIRSVASLEDFVRFTVTECRKADPALNVWASSFCQSQMSLTKKIVDQIRDGPEVGLYHAQPDLYVFHDEYVTSQGCEDMRNVSQPLFPYWFTPNNRPLPTAIKDTGVYKIMKDQGWTPFTMRAFFAHLGLTLLRHPGWQLNTQLTPFLFGASGTGKTSLLDMVSALIKPENKWTFNPGDSDNFLTAGLAACRAIFWPETRSDFGPGLVLYKQLTDNKDVTVNGKNKDTFQIVYEGALWLNGNREFWPTPTYKRESGRLNNSFQEEMYEYSSIARRLAFFPFTKRISTQDRIFDLDKRISNELPIYVSTALWCCHQAMEVPEEFHLHLMSEQMHIHLDNQFRFTFEDEFGNNRISESVVDRLNSYATTKNSSFIFE